MKGASTPWRRLRETVLVVAAVGLGDRAGAGQAQLPIPCVTGTCGSTTTFLTPVLGSSAAPKVTAVQSGNTLTINQLDNQAILNWATFNVSANGKVIFNQPGATAVALNRIFQANPSTIFGQVSANGQIYLINPNGFIFGSTAEVNAAGLIASTLGITDNVFGAGLLAPQILSGAFGSKAALSGNVGADGNPLPGGDPSTAAVVVDNGARISTPGGRMLLAAPTVENAGSLSAPDGQVVLAGGQNVYLLASTNPDLRGLVVEVDGNNAAAMNQMTSATNESTGVISTPRGNIWMVGLAVNQDGRLSATTSVSLNGSVHLEAGSSALVQGGGGSNAFTVTSQTGGTLTLGPQSSIDILPELSSSATAVADQVQSPSQITLLGQAIDMHDASITAPGGTLDVTAAAAPGLGVQTDGNSLARIRVDAGTRIDLAGSSVELPVTANLLAIQLRANELADDPEQRNGPLHGQTVYVDARVGSPLINQAAFASALDAVPESVGQRTEAGGKAAFESEGDVVIASGATIDVSGGHTTYDGGIFQTSLLAGTNGQLYNVGTANPSLSYSGVLNPTFTQTYNKWGVQDIVPTAGLSHYESGYVEGAAAGSVSIAAPSLALQGTLIGTATNGALQRANPVAGGTLVIGLPGGLGSDTQSLDFLAPGVEFVAEQTPLIVSDNAALPPQTLQLSTSYLAAGGFTSTRIYSNGPVTLPAGVPLLLSPGGSLLVDAPRITIDSSITAVDGNIELENSLTAGVGAGSARLGIDIGNGVTLDVSGQWTNDYSLGLTGAIGSGQLGENGGSIVLSPGVGPGLNAPSTSIDGSELVLGNEVALRANGGAWLQSNGKVTGGTGGSISLVNAPLNAAFQVGTGDQIEAFGVQGAAGGSFSLTVPRLLIGPGSSAWAPNQRVDDLAPNAGTAPGGVFDIGSSLFDRFGFSSVTLIATGAVPALAPSTDVLTVSAGTAITPLTQTVELLPGYLHQRTDAPLGSFTQAVTLPVGTRPVANLTLKVQPTADDPSLTHVGLFDLQTGASIIADPGATITLSGVGGILDDAVLRAPGGTISLTTLLPDGTPDPGYLPNLALELGPHAVIDASGTYVPTINNQNLQLGSVWGGGTVELLAERGSVITEPGSEIDVRGSSHPLDVAIGGAAKSYALYEFPSAAGSLVVSAPESISLLGKFAAQAGVGNYGDPAGGSLEVDLTRSAPFSFPTDPTLAAAFPTTPRIIELVSALPSNTLPSVPGSGQALLSISQLESSGIDSLRLEAGDEILFSSNLPLSLARQLILDAPAIAVSPGLDAAVNTNYAALGNTLPLQSTASPTPGGGNLDINAQQIDLIGSFVLQTANAHLNSTGDIMLRNVYAQSSVYGALSLDGNLELSAERVYPATDSTFSIATVHSSIDPSSMVDTVSLTQTGASPGVPLSAGGSVSISADQITSSGSLLAPYGTISLSAVDSLNLEHGSVTSVSGNGLIIPYGATELGGQEWFYTPQGGTPLPITGTPTRTVSLNAPTINVASGATVNLKGGGDVYAYEWVPGTGGTVDALGQNAATGLPSIPGLYAVLPSTRGEYAPYDPEETTLAGLSPGESIYLSGGGGLAAGIYPLLPARDALVPGAYLVQVQGAAYGTIVPGQPATLVDGTPVIAGYLTFGTTGLHTGGYEGVAVWPGSYGQSLAQYTVTDGSTFFGGLAATAASNAAPGTTLPHMTLPADAGTLSIDVSTALDFLGEVVGNAPGSAGIGSTINISAPELAVTAGALGASSRGVVTIAGSVIQSWNAGEVVLGGQASADGTSIAVTANSVTIDGGAQLSANEVILVANQSIDVQAGASVLSTSATAGGAAPTSLPATTTLSLNGASPASAAMLAVSDVELPIVQREGTATPGATINLEHGSTVGSLGALSLDAPGGMAASGTLNGAGASWSLAASSIGFVGSGRSADALQIDSSLQSALGHAAAIRLASDGAIDLYTPVLLGAASGTASPSLTSLTLAASSVINQGGASGSVFGAKTVTLEGAVVPLAPVAAGGNGSLSIVAGELDVGTGSLTIDGFQNTSLRASSAVVGQAVGGIDTGGNLSIATPTLTAVSLAQMGLAAPLGTLTVASGEASARAAAIANDLGGEIDLSANSIQLSSAIVVPAGIVKAQATQDIDVGSAAVIDTSGRTVVIGGHSFGAEGGAVTLTAGGNLTLAAGSRIDVSGAGDSPAGSIALNAGAAADVLASVAGHATPGAEGGAFEIEAGSLSQGLTPLADALQAGGFTAGDSIIAHTGNLILSSGATGLTANQILLVADTGSIGIDAPLTAPNASLRGTIGLYGGAGVTLDSNAVLSVAASSGAGVGGEIDLGTNAGGAIVLGAGSRLSGAGTVGDGTLLVRAPVTGTDVALTATGATLSGFDQVLVEPIVSMPIGTTLGPADLANIEATAAATVGALTPAIEARLNPSGALPLSVRAAVDLTQSGSLTLANSLDLYSYSSAGMPLDLSFRIGGSITVGSVVGGTPAPATLSDGFDASGPTLALSRSPSSSFRFAAGADASSPDPLALVAGSGGNLTLEPGSIIRTGTGEIDLAASANIVFSSPGASGGNTPLVYTAGIEPLNSTGQPIAGIAVAGSNYVFNFPTQGGAIRVTAGGDIQGAAVQESVTAWQLRQGYLGKPAQWGVDLDQLGWNITSVGGGDVSVQAAGSINELSVAAADSLYHPKGVTPLYIPSGGLTVSAGGDIGSGQFFLADGTSLLRAGGAFSAVEPVPGSTTNVGSSLALDNSQFILEARTGITLDAIYNPSANTETLLDPNQKLLSYFFTYGGSSAVTLQSTGGDVALNESDQNEQALLGAGAGVITANVIYPGTLVARSLLLDVSVPNAVLFPSVTGQLQLVAGRDLIGNGTLSMSDAALDSIPSAALTAEDPSTLVAAAQVSFSADLHAADPVPALLLAGRDIVNGDFQVPKAAEIIAGRDISNLFYEGQNLNAGDLTLVSAGRDVIDNINGGAGAAIEVGGPGRLDVLAGRNVDLGFSSGITTVGNTANPNLPTATGADLTVVAGLGNVPDSYSSFVSTIIAPDTTDQGLLTAYVESLTGQSGLSYKSAAAEFAALSPDQQRPLIDQVFFDTLSASGLQANTDPQAGYTLGYAAIDALFPNSRTAAASGPSPYQGNISLTFSRIYTLSGGGISLLAPGGELDVGLANPPANLGEAKTPAELGIVAQGTGDVDIYTQGDVNVNSSRIFTLGGGNILIWSDEGSIDAGRGSKSSVSAPPPQVLVDSSGNITLSFSGAVAGSGIRTIQIDPSVNPGNVNLVAPEGTVNAGDAGIGAAGDINISALHVVGLDNITFGGNASGVPAQVSNIGVSLAGASSTANAASNSSTSAAASNAEKEAAAAPLSQAALSWLDVFVTGLGEENCKPDDLECLKRQKKPGQ